MGLRPMTEKPNNMFYLFQYTKIDIEKLYVFFSHKHIRMNIPSPMNTESKQSIWTIYTKSNCQYCEKVKELLKDENVIVINCDNYLSTNRELFIETMRNLTGTEHKTFPMVFHRTLFIGGFTETKKTIDIVNGIMNAFSGTIIF